ncbi:hypothetical protein [Enterococcus faecalis]|uniref:hypothetical protein n=1 Tax=Enterococcus faecalis TaxID=1351 RepID=UPI003F3085E7
MENLLKELLKEQKKTNELLQTIASSKEQENINVDLQCDINKISEELARRIAIRQAKIENIISGVKQNQNGR